MRTLIAGFGNIFFRDDAFGPEVTRRFAERTVSADVCVRDFGTGGMHVAFEMLAGYDLVLIADAVARGGAAGNIYVIEPEKLATAGGPADAHAMQLQNVFAFYEQLERALPAVNRPRVLIVGCEPESTSEGIGLSDAVAAAIPTAMSILEEILAQSATGAPIYEKT